jgi:hypothetical protein
MKMLAMAGVLGLIATVATGEAVSQSKNWATIRPAQVKTFVTSENSKIVMDIYSAESPFEKLYVLRCNKGDANDIVPGENDYYGMFQCHLLSSKESGPELLEGENDWSLGKSYNTRGVFTYEQLIGPCRSSAEFGFHREFNMRGMKLEVTISNFSSPSMTDMLTEKIKPHFSFDFEAKVVPNKSAKTKYTSPSARKYCGGYYKINTNGDAVYYETGASGSGTSRERVN